MSSVVQAQWDLSGTSTDALSIGRGVLMAATSDNVQPLAILACERFGATLAMGRTACDHINDHVLPTPDHAVVGFLKAMVGYAKDDSATELGRSHAGIQFLALAAALLSTMSVFDSATMVWTMLKASASDKVLLPRQPQVKDLLARLEPRCKPSRFFEMAQGWQFRVQNWLERCGQGLRPLEVITQFPASDGVEKLVNAFRQSRRIGPTSVTRIEIKTSRESTAWVAAFTEWCLDEKPYLYWDGAKLLLDNLPSAVWINVSTSPAPLEVVLYHKADGPRSLVSSTLNHGPWTGMAKIENYGDWLLRQYEFDDGAAARIIRDVLPGALHQVAENLAFSPYKAYDSREAPTQWKTVEISADRPQIEETMKRLRVYPFPGMSALSSTLGMLTKGMATKLSPLKNGGLITDHPAIETHLRRLSETCACISCAYPGSLLETCKQDLFFRRLSTVVCDTYALSLFHCPQGLSVQIPIPQHSGQFNDLRSAVERILRGGEQVDVHFASVLDWALSLAGHRVSDQVREGNWVMSSASGQVVWPTVYDTSSFAKYGFLGLSWLRGELRYHDELYKSVQSTRDLAAILENSPASSESVVAPLNLVAHLRVDWEVQPGDGILKTAMRLSHIGTLRPVATLPPPQILANYATALMVEGCPHAHDAPLPRPDTSSSFTGPENPLRPALENVGESWAKTGIVAVDGANELRMYALGCGGVEVPVVMRGIACLGCCLDVCRRTGFPVLVL